MCFHFSHATYACGCVLEMSPCKPGFQPPKLCRPARDACRRYHRRSGNAPYERRPTPRMCPPMPDSEKGTGNITSINYDMKCPTHITLEDLNEVSAKHRNADYMLMLKRNINMAGMIFPTKKWQATTGDSNFVGEYEGEDGSFVGVESYLVGTPASPVGRPILPTVAKISQPYFIRGIHALSRPSHGNVFRLAGNRISKGMSQSRRNARPDLTYRYANYSYRPHSKYTQATAVLAGNQTSAPDSSSQNLSEKDTGSMVTYLTPHTPSRSRTISGRRRTLSI